MRSCDKVARIVKIRVGVRSTGVHVLRLAICRLLLCLLVLHVLFGLLVLLSLFSILLFFLILLALLLFLLLFLLELLEKGGKENRKSGVSLEKMRVKIQSELLLSKESAGGVKHRASQQAGSHQ